MRLLPSVVLPAACLALAGCGGTNPAIPPPSYDPEGMARAAMQQYDKNNNGKLEGAELNACPALKGALGSIDANKDKAISADELAARFRSYQDASVGAVGVACVVRLDDQPLTGAVVTFTPEDCMKGSVKGGSGTSDADGVVAVTGEAGAPGLPCGLYRITVSKKSAGGTEELPARYNSSTTLGYEVSASARGGGEPVQLNLTSP